MQNLTGQTIDRYHILEQIGEGGMAVVYKAYDTRLEREVAIKIIRKEAFPPESLDRIFKRFEREAKALARLAHPNIVKVHDYGEYEGSPYLVMEYQPGGTLKAMLGKPLDGSDVSKLLIPIANALEYAHQKGILHRDVKPSNILIAENGEPMLTDFGIAKILNLSVGQTLTSTGFGVGTPEYMAPEQGLGKDLDGRTDIYSLGVVLFELFTGRKPYTADTPLAILLMHMNDPLPHPRIVVQGMAVEIEKVILKALAKDPVNRYQSMKELKLALEKADAHGRNPKVDDHHELEVTKDESLVSRRGKEHKNIQWWHFALGGSVLIILYLLIRLLNPQIIPEKEDSKPFTPKKSSSETDISKNYPTSQPIATSTINPIPTSTISPVTTNTHQPNQIPNPNFSIGSTQVSQKDGMVMVYVPEGNFIMGTSIDDSLSDCVKIATHSIYCGEVGLADENPPHEVYLDAFWIDQTEVSNAQYQACVNAGNCKPKANYYLGLNSPDLPVVGVDWFQSQTYCMWVGRMLPTEAQWEKAARGEDGRIFPWGNEIDRTRANYGRYKGSTTNVNLYSPGASPYGVLNMAGNVAEWVTDIYLSNYYNLQDVWENPTGPQDGFQYVIKGGNWDNDKYDLHSADRGGSDPMATRETLGFRCVLPNN